MNSFTNGGILINITINKVYVFHKSLKEIEEFFTKLQKRIDENPIISELILNILSRDSIKMSTDNSILSNDKFFKQKIESRNISMDSNMHNAHMYRDLDMLS